MDLITKNVFARKIVAQVKIKGSETDIKRCSQESSQIWTDYLFKTLAQLIKDEDSLKIGHNVFDLGHLKAITAATKAIEKAGFPALKSSEIRAAIEARAAIKNPVKNPTGIQVKNPTLSRKDLERKLRKKRDNMKASIVNPLEYKKSRNHLAQRFDQFDLKSVDSDGIKAAKKILFASIIKPKIGGGFQYSDDGYLLAAAILRDCDPRALADNFFNLETYEMLEPYRGEKCGKYASDGQIKRFREQNRDLSRLPEFIDRSDPQDGFPITSGHLQDKFFEQNKIWYFHFDLDDEISHKPLGAAGYDFYRPTRAEDIEHLKELGFHQPQNWMYPGSIGTSFSIVKEMIESEWIKLPLKK